MANESQSASVAPELSGAALSIAQLIEELKDCKTELRELAPLQCSVRAYRDHENRQWSAEVNSAMTGGEGRETFGIVLERIGIAFTGTDLAHELSQVPAEEVTPTSLVYLVVQQLTKNTRGDTRALGSITWYEIEDFASAACRAIDRFILKLQARADTPQNAVHGPDFGSTLWFGKKYIFTPTQAACVKVLWEAWRLGTAEVGESTVLESADSSSSRLRDVFDKGQHPAWGTMIQSPGKGLFKLAQDGDRRELARL